MSIDFCPVRYDAEEDMFWIPQAEGAEFENCSINVSQANGIDILAALGIDASFGLKSLDEFSRLLAAARQRDLATRKGQVSTAIPERIDAVPGQMTVIDCGRRRGYIEDRLSQLSALVAQGRNLGATHISWG